ncbi:MAG: hypothetical protein FJ009_16395 [Chloroflexi bacterium]|nr:hypothetical protein [Chloroflexota bacterium]
MIKPSTPLVLMTSTPSAGRTASFETIASGDQAADFPQRAEIIIRSADDWAALWKRVYCSLSPTPALPAVDFSRRVVVAVFAGSTGVLEIRVDDVRQTDDAIVVKIVERVRRPGDIGVTAILYPFHIVSFPKTDLPIRFERANN